MRTQLKKLIKPELFRFAVIGGLATGIDFAVYMLLNRWLYMSLAKFLSMLAASVLSYLCNKNWTFRSKESTKSTITKFYTAQGINILFNTGLNRLVFLLTGNVYAAFIGATGLAMLLNYTLQRVWVFRDKGRS